MSKTRALAKTLMIALLLAMTFPSCNLTEPESEYTVQYDANGASGTPPESVTIKSGGYITVPGYDGLSYNGKGFAGWNTAPDGAGKACYPGWVLLVDTNITLYAQWVSFVAPQNVSVRYTDGFLITWDPIPGLVNVEDIYMTEGVKVVTCVIFRYNKSSGNFEACGYSETASYRDTRWNLVEDQIFNYIVAMAEITYKNFDYVITKIGPESKVASGGTLYGLGEVRPAPTGLSAIGLSPTQIYVSWDAVPGAYGYRIYSSGVTLSCGLFITTTEYIDTDGGWLDPGETRDYRVASVNGFYEIGPLSAAVSATTPASDMPMLSYNLSFKNNHSYPVTAAYLRRKSVNNWGNNLISDPILTNVAQLLGTFNYGIYDIKAQSILKTRLTTGNGITAIIDHTIYVPVYYNKSITLTEDRTLIARTTDWSF
jgi:hypothetical protein